MNHKDLDVWKRSMDLVVKVYRAAKEFPEEECYGLTGQVKRAVISIPSNIAEGAGRRSDKEIIQFLSIALGSSSELETQILISLKLGYLKDSKDLLAELTIIRKMLINLIKTIKNKNKNRV